jgi:hypothetical protein
VSAFDATGKLLISEGVVETDQTIETLLSSLYTTHGIPYEKNLSVVTIDVVTSLYEEHDVTKIASIDMKLYGLAVIDENDVLGVILPDTE